MKNLIKLRSERNISQQKLAEEFHLSQQSIYKYEHDLAEPDIQTLKDFANYFHTSIDYLIDFQPDNDIYNKEKHELTSDEIHILLLYQALPPDIREHLIAIMEKLQNAYTKPENIKEKGNKRQINN